jgi:hypothetical protein
MAIATINGIPVFNATLEAEECGIYRISLVDVPAVESNFVAYGKQGEIQKYSVLNDEKRLVRGVILRADFPIYRIDENIGEYYIVHSAEMIRQTAQKMLREHRNNEVNIMHQALTEVKGVEMVQMFIKDTNAGVNPAGFEDIENGSLFAEYHVTNDDVWAAIKAGTFKGFSLEGIFTFQPKKAEEALSLETITKYISKASMSIKQKLAKILAQFRSLTTDKGVISWEGDKDLEVGDSVFVEAEDGERTPAADGDYTLEDGVIVRVENGNVTEIVEPDAEADAEEDAPEQEQEAEAEAEAAPEDAPQADTEEDRLAALEERVTALEGIIAQLREVNQTMAAQLEAIEKKPMALPAQEQLRATPSITPTGNRRTDGLLKNLPKH